jgi:hypothetical protein
MFFEPVNILRLCGIAGFLGALIMATGDLLYHHVPGSTQTVAERMSSLPQTRLVSAGALGLVGSWLYVLGAFHLYYAFLPAGVDFALAISLTFAMVMIAYGVGHASYYAIGSSAKVARDHGLDIEAAGKIGEALFSRIVIITYIPVTIASLLMLYCILSGQSAYPLWIAPFLPIVLYLLRPLVLKVLRGRVHELVRDSYDNFVLLVFFLLSTAVLWNR